MGGIPGNEMGVVTTCGCGILGLGMLGEIGEAGDGPRFIVIEREL